MRFIDSISETLAEQYNKMDLMLVKKRHKIRAFFGGAFILMVLVTILKYCGR